MPGLKRIKLLSYLICLISLLAGADRANSVSKETRTLHLGEEKVWVDIYKKPGTDIILLNLHDNENTAPQAGKIFLEKHGGRLIELRHGRGREVVVRLKGKLHRFDPNRMFSTAGLRKSLKYFRNNRDDVFAIAAGFRDSLIDIMAVRPGMLVISLHNNTPDKMSIKDFAPEEWYGQDIREIFINPERDPDNFFVVTKMHHFTALELRGYNVALKAHNPVDRGMVIDYIDHLGAVCVTIETEQDKLAVQEEMLEVLWRIIKDEEKKIATD